MINCSFDESKEIAPLTYLLTVANRTLVWPAPYGCMGRPETRAIELIGRKLQCI